MKTLWSGLIGIRIGSPDNTCDHVCEEPVNTLLERLAPSESRSIPLAVISVRRCAELGLAMIIRIGTLLPHSITSLVRARIACGISTRISRATLRSRISSDLVGC